MNEDRYRLYDCSKCPFMLLTCMHIPPEEFELIRRTSIQLKFVKGETIFKQGNKSTHMAFLHKGIVKFVHRNETEKDFIMAIVKGTKLLGAANLFFKETNIFSLVAVEDSDICLIDNKALRNAAMKHGNLMLSMSERTIEMFQDSIFNFISLAHKQVIGRIADILLYLWEHIYKDSPYKFTLSRKELAEFASCSHENVITTLSKFNKEGIITLEGKLIIINDFKKLQEISKHG
jgi:CRP/FNR family transcriptional regulator, polysaccharide utilization system transcription regulator